MERNKSKSLSPEQLETVLRLYKKGTLLKEIERQTGVDTSTISRTAKANGLKPRNPYKPHRPKAPGYKGPWYTIVDVKSRKGRVNHHKRTHLARCDYCGSERWYPTDYLGKVQSCGCRKSELSSEAHKTHGETGGRKGQKTPEYQAWTNFKAKMKRERMRAANPTMTDQQPSPYDPRWVNYKDFLEDVGRRPHPDYCFTRIDETGGYFKDNVEWGPRSQLAVYDIKDIPDERVSGPKPYQHNYKVGRIPRRNSDH